MAQAATSPRYLPHGAFRAELHRRVAAHLASRGQTSTAPARMRLKVAIIATWLVGSYVALMWFAPTVWLAVPLAISLGLAMAAVGFNVQHDGGHRSASRSRRWNLVVAHSLDLLGGSSYLWHWKHNVLHHSHPNLDGYDADIDIRPFCRIAPSQPRHALHRFQHVYVWFLYSFLAVKWQFVDDFIALATGKIGTQRIPRPKGWPLVSLIAGKLFFFGWAVVLPLLVHPLLHVVAYAALTSVVLSLTLAITFQLAHVIEGATFGSMQDTAPATTDWSEHQVHAAVNFAPQNPVLTWFMGGLNFQIEHHLFPHLSHLHLSAVAPIVRETCLEFGVPYRVQPTFGAALASHVRWIRSLGQPPVVAG